MKTEYTYMKMSYQISLRKFIDPFTGSKNTQA